MKVEKKRGTDSLPSFTASTIERLSGKNDCDEWLYGDS